MASNDENNFKADTTINTTPASPISEAKRKVSILTDVAPHQAQGYDNPAFDGPDRKISVAVSKRKNFN